MIQSNQALKYQDKTLVEKIIIQTPHRYKSVFQNHGCFLYIKGNPTKLLSSEVNLELKDREALLLKCGTYVADWMDKINSPLEVIAVHLFPEILKKLYKNELPKTFSQRKEITQVKAIVPDDTMKRFIESLEFYFENPAIVNEDLLELKIKELMLLLVQSKNASSVLELIEELYYPRAASLKKVIELHKYESLSIEELSQLCGLSLSSFKREFKAIYKDSPNNYLNTQKIEKAKTLLEFSELTINEIAYEVGFGDPYYFSRLFKKKEDIPPSQYRTDSKN